MKASDFVQQRWFPLFDIGLTATAATLWFAYPGALTWEPLALLLLPRFALVLGGAPVIHRSALDCPMLIFLLTAGIGVWASYDQSSASSKFWILLSSVGLFYSLAGQSRRHAWLLCGGLGALSSLGAVYFALANDWRIIPADMDFLQRAGLAWMRVRPSFQFSGIHPNAAGGMMAALAPSLIAFGLFCRHSRRTGLLGLTIVMGLMTAVGLLMTSSRGAWLSLWAGLMLWGLWEMSRRFSKATALSAEAVYLIILLALATLGSITAVVTASGPFSILASLPGPDATSSRLELWDQALRLCRDYFFTGGGLGGFAGHYSTYIRVTPFFLFSYSHNLYLDVLLEQGIGGLGALLGVLAGSLALLVPLNLSKRDKRISRQIRHFRWAIFAGLVVQVLHGIMDDAMYGNHGTPLLFLLPGVAVAFGAKYSKPRPAEQRLRRRIFALSSLALILIAFAATSGRTSAGIWYSNLGAVAMAKVELADWPTNQWSEGDYGSGLSDSAGLFTRALQLDPENVTAYHRLGLIAMHRRDFSQAASLLRNAHARDRHHRGVAKSFAYSALWAGQFKEAAVLLVAFPESRRELEAYSHWWKLHGREDLAASAASMVAHLSSLISDPS